MLPARAVQYQVVLEKSLRTEVGVLDELARLSRIYSHLPIDPEGGRAFLDRRLRQVEKRMLGRAAERAGRTRLVEPDAACDRLDELIVEREQVVVVAIEQRRLVVAELVAMALLEPGRSLDEVDPLAPGVRHVLALVGEDLTTGSTDGVEPLEGHAADRVVLHREEEDVERTASSCGRIGNVP